MWTLDIFLFTLLHILYIGIVSTGVSAESCPVSATGGVTRISNHTCYLFVHEEVYWKTARKSCWSKGGEMLIISDRSVQDFITSTLNSKELDWHREGVWLGAEDTGRNSWRWTNGKEVGYSNWASGEPSALWGAFSVEDCALMRKEDNWQWHDNLCGSLRYHYNYICQFPAIDSPEETSTTEGMMQDAPPMNNVNHQDFNPKFGHAIHPHRHRQHNKSHQPSRHDSSSSHGDPSPSHTTHSPIDVLVDGVHSEPNPDSDYLESLGKKLYEFVNAGKISHSDHPALGRPGDKIGKLSPSATNQEDDNGYTTILAVVIGMGCGFLLVFLIIFLLFYRHNRSARRKNNQNVPVHFHNSPYENSSSPTLPPRYNDDHSNEYEEDITLPPPPPPCQRQSPPIPPMRPPPAREDLYLTPSELDINEQYAEINKPKPVATAAHLATSDPDPHCSCRDPLASAASCSSLASGEFLGACGGSDLDGGATMPLMSDNQIKSSVDKKLKDRKECTCGAGAASKDVSDRVVGGNDCVLTRSGYGVMNNGMAKEGLAETNNVKVGNNGDYIDMRSLSSKENICEGSGQKLDSMKGKGGQKTDEMKGKPDPHTYSNVDHIDTAVENVYEVLQ